MFNISKEQKEGFGDIWRLKDESSQTYAEIIPSCGAMLHAFVVNNKGEKMNVIDSPANPEDFKNSISKYFKGCKLSPFVCRIRRSEERRVGKECRSRWS